jgi:hypothetical protein
MVTESNRKNTKNAINEDDERNDTLPFVTNSKTDTSGACFKKNMQHCLQNGGIENNQENLQNGESSEETFKKAKRFPSSVMICLYNHSVIDPLVVNMIKVNIYRMKEAKNKALRKNDWKIYVKFQL